MVYNNKSNSINNYNKLNKKFVNLFPKNEFKNEYQILFDKYFDLISRILEEVVQNKIDFISINNKIIEIFNK